MTMGMELTGMQKNYIAKWWKHGYLKFITIFHGKSEVTHEKMEFQVILN